MLRAPRGHLLPEYRSIGQFYEETMKGRCSSRKSKRAVAEFVFIQGMDVLSDNLGDKLFDPSTVTKQFQTADGSWYDGDMTAISDIDTARAALTVVIEQGEGSTGQAIKNTVQSHYQVFRELQKNPELDCYPVVLNPITSQYEGQKIHKVMSSTVGLNYRY
jgi:hypothetical protein